MGILKSLLLHFLHVHLRIPIYFQSLCTVIYVYRLFKGDIFFQWKLEILEQEI